MANRKLREVQVGKSASELLQGRAKPGSQDVCCTEVEFFNLFLQFFILLKRLGKLCYRLVQLLIFFAQFLGLLVFLGFDINSENYMTPKQETIKTIKVLLEVMIYME